MPSTLSTGSTWSTSSTLILERESAALLRAMVLDKPAPPGAASPKLDPLADWRAYQRALELPDAAARAKALRAVYSHSKSALVRATVLRAISENPQFQGRQALFIRRYGFYANWFNRLVFSASGLVQGNLQAATQLFVDGINDLLGAGEADPNTRRAYDMLRRAQDRGGRPALDPKELSRLERTVAEALADGDMNMAQWALKHGDPEAALFYAQQAAALRPDWKKAQSAARTAEGEVARLRRDRIASTQVGYPDRTPPVEPATPELLRSILGSGSGSGSGVPPSGGISSLPTHERLVAAALNAPTSPTLGHAAAMRLWKALLSKDAAPEAPAHRWLTAVVYDPRTNVDQRLAETRSAHRASLWRYVFVGPERPRERFYKTATWLTTAWTALANVGVFYIFDVALRAGQAVWSRPVPAEELLDAQAAWLREAPDPQNAEARKLAENLFEVYLAAKRYEDARAVLKTAGLLDEKRSRKINKAQAISLLETARQMPEGSDRRAMVMRIEALDPGSRSAKNAAAIENEEKKHAELLRLDLDWTTMARWTELKPPCGLPGDARWFDGSPAGGEAWEEGLIFERRQGDSVTTMRYPVKTQMGQRVYQVNMENTKLPPAIRQWFALAATQRSEASQVIRKLRRLPIPVALEGGAGTSGIDFYPKLLPLQSRPGEIELYR